MTLEALVVTIVLLLPTIIFIYTVYKRSCNNLYDPEFISKYVVWYLYHYKHRIISRSKLMAIMYVEQGVFLAKFNRCLFKENFIASRYGIIIPSVFKKFKSIKDSAMPIKIELDFSEKYCLSNMNKKEIEVFHEVINKMALYSGNKLRDYFISNDLYKKHLNDNSIISKEEVKEYFKRYIINR